MKVESESEFAQSCPTLSDPTDCSLTRLLRPWDFPGKSPGVGCHCLLRDRVSGGPLFCGGFPDRTVSATLLHSNEIQKCPLLLLQEFILVFVEQCCAQ